MKLTVIKIQGHGSAITLALVRKSWQLASSCQERVKKEIISPGEKVKG